jgi:hypothetical protein
MVPLQSVFCILHFAGEARDSAVSQTAKSSRRATLAEGVGCGKGTWRRKGGRRRSLYLFLNE